MIKILLNIKDYKKYIEASFFISALLIVSICSLINGDNIFAFISAFFGLIYTILAGKGKVYCYFFGIIGTLCCAYISFNLALYGYFLLHLFYYFPAEIIGFFQWKKHLIAQTDEIIKDKLSVRNRIYMSLIVIVLSGLAYIWFRDINDASPICDALTIVLSVTAMILTIKRCIEQLALWTVLNFISIIMWLKLFLQGEGVLSIFIVRIIYFILGIYFFISWKSSIENDKELS